MSTIFNQSALHGLSTAMLHHRRSFILQRLGAADLAASEHAQLHVALASIHAVMRSRVVPSTPSAPSP